MKRQPVDLIAEGRARLNRGEWFLWVPEVEHPYTCRTLDEGDHFVARVEEIYGQIDGNVEFDYRDRAA